MSHPHKRVLGVDPGLTRCGIGVIQGSVGKPITLIGVGVILTSSDLPLERR
jgi:crossover junction endodeoxyribonuclease RuvC